MKRLLHTSSTLFFIITILFANPSSVLANEGDGGNLLEMEVNGYHVTLASQNDWAKGENTIVVTLTDSMGMPVRNTEVELLIAPREGGHDSSETDAHGSDEPQEAMPGMDMGNDQPQESVPGIMSPNNPSDMSAHEEESASAIAMMESEHGMYMVETHLESSGEHQVHVMFHVNGEMLQADFIVEVVGGNSKTIVLWSFVVVNLALVASARIMKRQPILVKGGQ